MKGGMPLSRYFAVLEGMVNLCNVHPWDQGTCTPHTLALWKSLGPLPLCKNGHSSVFEIGGTTRLDNAGILVGKGGTQDEMSCLSQLQGDQRPQSKGNDDLWIVTNSIRNRELC